MGMPPRILLAIAATALSVSACTAATDSSGATSTSTPTPLTVATSSAAQSPQELVDELTSRRELYGMRINGVYIAPDGRVVLLVQSTNREGLDGLRSRYGDRVIVQEADAGNDAGTER